MIAIVINICIYVSIDQPWAFVIASMNNPYLKVHYYLLFFSTAKQEF